jgi:hypothetical protein
MLSLIVYLQILEDRKNHQKIFKRWETNLRMSGFELKEKP